MTTSVDASSSSTSVEPGGLLITDANAVIKTVSPELARWVGHEASDFPGRSALSFIHNDDLNTVLVTVGAIAESPGRSWSLRFRLRRSDGSFALARGSFTHDLDAPADACIVAQIRPSATAVLDSGGTAHRLDGSEAPVSANPVAPLVQDLTAGLLLSDADGVQFISPSLGRLLEQDHEELYATYGDLIHPDDQAEMVTYVEQLASPDHEVARVQVRIERGDGTWGRYLIQSIDLLADPDYGHYVTLIQDARTDGEHTFDGDGITSALRIALNRAADPVVVIGEIGQIRFASSPAHEMFACPVAELMAKPFRSFLDDRSVDTWDRWFAGAERTSPVSVQIRRGAGSDDRRWVEVHPLVEDAGAAVQTGTRNLIVTLVDVDLQVTAQHALARREARFAAMVRNAPGGVAVVDESARVIGSAHSLEGPLGIRSDLVTGLHLADWVDPDQRPALDAAMERACTTNEAVTVTVGQRVADGTTRQISWTIEDHRDDPSVAGLVVNLFDRTAELEAQRALRESERRFRSLVQHSFEITVIIDESFTITWVSPSVKDLLGWDPAAVTGQGAAQFIHPDDVDLVFSNLEASMAGATPRPFTIVRIGDRAGEWHHVVASSSDRRDDPDVGGIIINLRDAEDQVASAQALAESESRYRTLVQNSADVVQIMSANARVQWVSPAVEHVLGWRPDEIVGLPVGSLVGLSGREELVEAFLEVLAEPGATARTVSRAQHADGSWRWIDVVLTNRLDQPQINGVVATYRDVTERIENERARHESEERFRSLAESSPLGIFQLDLEQRCSYVNDRWCEITGQWPEQALGDGWRTCIRRGGNRLGEPEADVDRYHDPGPSIRLIREDGEARWCAIHFAPLTDDKGERIGTVGTIDDVTTAVDARQEARRLSTILQSTPDLVVLFVPEGTLEYLNEAACNFFDVPDGEAVRGLPVSEILPAENIELWSSQILPALEERRPWQGETTVRNRRGDVIPISAVVLAHRDPTGAIEMVSITARDMSDRKALEARLLHQATHDPLTGLPNRTLLLDRLEMAMARAHRSRGRLAVLFLDLDHFKVVNDSLGHGTGDELLMVLAGRLTDQVRPGDTVARFGGDEFVIVCEELDDETEAAEIATRIASAMAEPAWIGGSEVFVTASVGIAMVDHLHHQPDQVLRDADAAMYQAKARGRARHEMFDPRFRTRALDRLEIENALRRALARDQLVVHYQPVFDIATGRVAGIEALLRWQHPQRNLLLPSEFLNVAEESGLIVPIGEWVLHTACEQSCRLVEQFGELGRIDVAVNLSARQIADPRLVERITEILDATGVEPANLTFEITESILMDDVVQSNETLGRLKALGIGLAIDDFGTGYSSFAYLQRFPVDILKVDRSFVSGLGSEGGDSAITEAIVTLSHTLGLIAVAEGVESEAQLEVLARIGCDRAQGFWQSRPLSSADLEEFLLAALD